MAEAAANAPPDTAGAPAATAEQAGRNGATDNAAQTIDESVPTAFALGWHVAEVFHGQVPLGPPDQQGQAPDRLPGISDLNSYERFRMLLLQVETGLDKLEINAQAGPISDSLHKTYADLSGPQIKRGEVLDDLLSMHKAILIALTAGNFKLGKAYGLGRALAETCLVPCDAALPDRPAKLAEQFNPHRLTNLYNWLADLKSSLPPHTAYAVSSSLRRWQMLLNTEPATTGKVWREDAGATRALYRQGQLWRSLLSGEKQAQDLLQATDFVDAAGHLLHRFRTLANDALKRSGPLLLLFLLVVFVVALAIAAGAALLDRVAAVWAALLTGLAGLAGAWQSASKGLGDVIGKARQPLWDSELDESIAVAATYLPKGAPPAKRRPDDKVGQLFQENDAS
jgi:hypothetical protein